MRRAGQESRRRDHCGGVANAIFDNGARGIAPGTADGGG
jgi:hypothetical protein